MASIRDVRSVQGEVDQPRSGVYLRGRALAEPRIRANRSRIEIRGLLEGSSHSLMGWLSARREVAEVDLHPDTGALSVKLSGQSVKVLLAGVRDRLFLLGRSPPAPFAIEVARATTGRARLAVSGMPAEALDGLASWL